MCKKQYFVSPQDAKRAASRSKVSLRPYRCRWCHGYHLSSMSKRELRAARKRCRELSGRPKAEGIRARQELEAELDERHRKILSYQTGGR